jgi:hypothetical protein
MMVGIVSGRGRGRDQRSLVMGQILRWAQPKAEGYLSEAGDRL